MKVKELRGDLEKKIKSQRYMLNVMAEKKVSLLMR